MIAIKKILVPVDFSLCSKAALDHAIHFGRALGVEAIDVMHVWRPPRFIGPETKVRSADGREQTLTEFARGKTGHAMKEFLSALEQAGSFSVRGRLEEGLPHQRILEIASAERYDLIIMGTQGAARTDKLGSIAERVVRNAACPVLTIRQQGGTVPPVA